MIAELELGQLEGVGAEAVDWGERKRCKMNHHLRLPQQAPDELLARVRSPLKRVGHLQAVGFDQLDYGLQPAFRDAEFRIVD